MAYKKIVFDALVAQQSPNHQVVMIKATAAEIQQIASIERLGRTVDGKTTGFQRSQISGHISEIRDYLEQSDAVLPNALVLAFVGDAKLVKPKGSSPKLEITISDTKPGYVVDGQQRLTALTMAERPDFQAFVACLICKNVDELRRQFILINNTRPLPKSLIYELLPGVENLPERLSSRTLAAAMIERLNFDEKSALHGMIKMQTNPTGLLKDTTLQKAIMNSEAAGAVQVLMHQKNGLEKSITLFENFYRAVRQTFPDDWDGHKPTTSRLVHGAGIVAMGYVMDEIYARTNSIAHDSFMEGLAPLKGKTAWSSGRWEFASDDIVPWNGIEFTPRQYQKLAEHLVAIIRRGKSAGIRKRKAA